jgi:outer membrane protein
MKNLRKLLCVSGLSIASVVASNAFAADKKNSDDQLKIAIVDVQAAILQTNEGKAAREKIEKDVTKKRQELVDQQKNLKKLQDEFQAQQAVLSDAEKQAKQKEFQTKLQAFQQAQMTFEQESRQKEAGALQKIFINIQTEVKKIAKEKGFDMVFDKSAAVLLYANNTTDITSQVVSLYNADYKASSSK